MASRRLVMEGVCGSTFRATSLCGKRDTEIDADPGPFMEGLQQVEVPLNERGLGNHGDGVAKFNADRQTGAGEFVRGFQRLIAVGVAGKDHEFAVPRGFQKRRAKRGRRIGFHDEFGFEIRARAESPILVTRAGIAIGTGMKAAAIRIHAPPEGQVGAVVSTQDGPGLFLKNLSCDVGRRFEEFPVVRVKGVRRNWRWVSRVPLTAGQSLVDRFYPTWPPLTKGRNKTVILA